MEDLYPLILATPSLSSALSHLEMPAPHGFTMRGWDFSAPEVSAAIKDHRLLNAAVEFGTNACPWNCAFCFTEDPANPHGRKTRLANEMTIERRLELIDELAALGCRTVNFVGAGEPTIDPHFWAIVDKLCSAGIVPIIYTEAALKLRDRSFAQRLFDAGATVVVKVNSLWNADYQNAIVKGENSARPSLPRFDYTVARNEAIELLLDLGFARDVPTRLAFDTIITRRNLGEIEQLHRYARRNNIFVLLVNYLPSGRSSEDQPDAVPFAEQSALFKRLAAIDQQEFNLSHSSCFPYGGGVPCTIRGLGLYVKITGSVFDCPGESRSLGTLNDAPLSQIWQRARDITLSFDGGCYPRRLHWEQQAAKENNDAVKVHGGVS